MEQERDEAPEQPPSPLQERFREVQPWPVTVAMKADHEKAQRRRRLSELLKTRRKAA